MVEIGEEEGKGSFEKIRKIAMGEGYIYTYMKGLLEGWVEGKSHRMNRKEIPWTGTSRYCCFIGKLTYIQIMPAWISIDRRQSMATGEPDHYYCEMVIGPFD